jgi:hypothetical protein
MSFGSRRFFWSAPAERSGDGALVVHRKDPKRCRAALATAVQREEQP